MKQILKRLRVLVSTSSLLAILCITSFTQLDAATSAWVSMGTCHLQYKLDAQGNKIMDYSYAGYGGGGVALPVVAVAATVTPVAGDNTANIQAAINTVSALPLAGGFRGAVLLEPGNFNVSGNLTINASGVVLRGSGSGTGGTTVTMTNTSYNLLLDVAGSGSWATTGNKPTMTDAYVPSGAVSFNVSSSTGFAVGDTILVQRPTTAAWIAYMNMNTIPNSDGDGTYDTWIAAGTVINTDRTITAINGNNITLDVPLTDSFDSTYLTGTIQRYTYTGRISNVGVEDFQIIGPNNATIQADTDLSTQYQWLNMSAVIDGWCQNMAVQDTENGVNLSNTTKRITFNNITMDHTYVWTASAGPEDFVMNGTQELMEAITITNNSGVWAFSCLGPSTGPVVVLNCSAAERGFEPHMRWSTGLLADDCDFPGNNGTGGGQSGIAYSDRGNFGSGHGWDAGWAVAWNVSTVNLSVQAPPGVDNWCIGCIGTEYSSAAPGGTTILPNGIYDSLGTHVSLGSYSSLYLAQLNDRLSGGCSTPTATVTQTYTKSPTATLTNTPSSTSTSTFTATVSKTFTNTITNTPTNTFSSTATYTYSNTPTTSPTGTASFTPSSTETRTFTATASNTSTNTVMNTSTPMNTATAVNTSTNTSSSTPSATATNSFTPTLSSTATQTLTLTNTAVNTATNTPVFTNSPVNTLTNSPTGTATLTDTVTVILSSTPTSTNTLTASNTPTRTATNSATVTSSLTATITLTSTATGSNTVTNTSTATSTLTRTPTTTSTETSTFTASATSTLTATFTATKVPPTSSPTGTFTLTATNTPTTGTCSGLPNWNGNFVAYSVGQKVDYNGEVYQCIQAHTSEPTWEPPVVPALWKDLGPCGSTPTAALVTQSPLAYPNPATSSTVNIQLPMDNATNVTVQVFTVAFREVQKVTMPQVMGNTMIVSLIDKSGIQLADGLYYFVIQANGQKWTMKVLVLR